MNLRARSVKIVAVFIVVISTFIAAKYLMTDTLQKAATRMSHAVIDKRPGEIYRFIGPDERQLYGLDESKFNRFWNKFVAARTGSIMQFQIESESEKRVKTRLFDQAKRKEIVFELSDNDGTYVSPTFIATICNSCASLDAPRRKTPIPMNDWFTYLAWWYRKNKDALESMGINGIKTNPSTEYQTIEELISVYEAQSQELKPPPSESPSPA